MNQLDLVVESDYVVVMFYQGMSTRPSWSWLRQAYSELSRKYRKNLKNLYIVHPSMWHKLLMGVMSVFVSVKFAEKLVYIPRLADLQAHVSLSQLYIPDVVRSYDAKYYGPTVIKPAPSTSGPTTGQIGVPLAQLMANGGLPIILVETAANIRQEGLKVTGLFRRSPSQVTLVQVIEKYNVGEKVDLSSYDIHLSAVLLKKFFRDLPGGVLTGDFKDKFEKLKGGG